MPPKKVNKPVLTEEQRQVKREIDKLYRRQKRWHDNILQGIKPTKYTQLDTKSRLEKPEKNIGTVPEGYDKYVTRYNMRNNRQLEATRPTTRSVSRAIETTIPPNAAEPLPTIESEENTLPQTSNDQTNPEEGTIDIFYPARDQPIDSIEKSPSILDISDSAKLLAVVARLDTIDESLNTTDSSVSIRTKEIQGHLHTPIEIDSRSDMKSCSPSTTAQQDDRDAIMVSTNIDDTYGLYDASPPRETLSSITARPINRRPKKTTQENTHNTSHLSSSPEPSTGDPISDNQRDGSSADIDFDSSDNGDGRRNRHTNAAAHLANFNTVEHFHQHLTKGFFCTHTAHNQKFEKHCDDLRKAEDSHDNCIDLNHLAINSDPTVQRNRHIPNFTTKKYIYRGSQLLSSSKYPIQTAPDLTSKVGFIPASTYRYLYEGKADDNAKPARLCMFDHEFTARHQVPYELPDIDSACGEVDSFGAFKKGWLFHPYSIPIMTSKCRGVRIKIDDILAPDGYWMVPPDEVPHVLIGKLSSWGFINIYILFPQLWLQRRRFKDSSPYLTINERRSLYENVLYPSFVSSMPENERADIPSTFDMAVSEAETTGYEQGRQQRTTDSRLQMLHHAIKPRFSHAFTLACREKIASAYLDNFSDFRIFFNAKNMKDNERQLSYSELRREWNTKWNTEFDHRFITLHKYWLDLGRQFTPQNSDEDAPTQLLWKPCCLNTYWQSRTKPFGHTETLNFQQYHLGHCRDIISTTITAKTDSVQYHSGICHSAFYGKHKEHFVTNTISVFESKDIDVIAHSESLIAAVSREGGASTAGIPTAASHLIHGLIRADNALHQIATQSGQAREEHRLRGDIFQDLLDMLVQTEEENGVILSNNRSTSQESDRSSSLKEDSVMTPYQRQMRDVATSLSLQYRDDPSYPCRYLPFWNVSSNTFASFLRGNLNKACMGFEVVIRDINTRHVTHETTATALMFLSLMRCSTLSKSLTLVPELYRNEWKPLRKEGQASLLDDDSSGTDIEALQREGMGMKENMKEFGYGYFKSKIDWSTWRIHTERAVNFFRNEPVFVQSMRARRKQVLHIWEWKSVLGIVRQWMTEADTAQKRESVMDFITSYVILAYRHAVWAQLKDNSVLDHHSQEVIDMLLSGRVPVTFSNVAKYVRDADPAVPPQPDLANSNRNFHKGDPANVLEYLFGWEEYVGPKRQKKKRDHWDTKMFRVVYKEICMLLTDILLPHTIQAWKKALFLLIHATNPLLPNPDGTQFISRKQNSKGYAWLAYDWIDGLGPFKTPLSCQELASKIYPGKTYAGGSITRWCSTNNGVFFDGTPPKLMYEIEFLGKSIANVQHTMKKKWNKLE